MHPYKRSQRVAELLREEVARIIQEEIKDLPGGLVTITGVDLCEYLSSAKIFFTVFGSAEIKAETERKLKHSTAYIKSLIVRRIRLYMPELQFR
jgi:ribosome-binding factor A